MKQQKLSGYTPNYPRKAVKGMALAAAALMALGTTVGCGMSRTRAPRAQRTPEPTPGLETPCPTDDVQVDGYIQPEETPGEEPAIMGMMEYRTPEPEETPEPEDLRTGGVAMPEETPEPEEIMLSGDVAILDEP